MPQLNLYVDETTHLHIKRSAKASGVSLSKWVSDLVREKTAREWPAEVLALSGAWKDFPSLDDIRKTRGKDSLRETF